ncbi:MAG TPA: SRPBCC domain-containing protein [Candidatus Acidoferrum sp.]|nr:SRPBCC domain-containing protein [Candidatus Acidoferrum sp.]
MSGDVQIESGERELRITRIFDAPRPLVFEAWSKAEHLKHWFAPDGFTVPACELDFRVGGAYRLCMRGFGNDHWVHGVYREIVVPERIVWTGILESDGNEMVTTITFADYQGKTRLSVHQTYSKETDSTRGAREGWTQTLEHLAEYVATLSRK